jgi:hypothetical protein
MAMNNEFKSIWKFEVGLLPWNVPGRNEETRERQSVTRTRSKPETPKFEL